MGKEKDSIENLIEKSGNNFHFEVVKFLRDKGWKVLISPYYSDNITDKLREIDIIAEKEFLAKSPYFPISKNLNIRFFIECKYINSDTVFWFDNKDKEKANKRVEKDISLKVSSGPAHLINQHHYLRGKQVAKLFESGHTKSQEYEIIYKALNQSLNAMIYYKNPKPILPKEIKTINYPLILCNNFNHFYKIDSQENSGYTKINDMYFQLEVNYVYLDNKGNSSPEYFLIDIVNFDKFGDFLEDLGKNEINTICCMWADQLDKEYIGKT